MGQPFALGHPAHPPAFLWRIMWRIARAIRPATAAPIKIVGSMESSPWGYTREEAGFIPTVEVLRFGRKSSQSDPARTASATIVPIPKPPPVKNVPNW